MTDSSKLDRIPPLGKSVEEVEQDAANAVNPSTPHEDRGEGRASFTPIMQTNLSAVPNAGGPAASGLNASRGADERDAE